MPENRVEFDGKEIPAPDFINFFVGISHSVYIYLGLLEDPITKQKRKNLIMAKHTIDTLEMLLDKTKGNFDEKEDNITKTLLAELKLKYVEISNSSDKTKTPADNK